jgi:hypothetical protein
MADETNEKTLDKIEQVPSFRLREETDRRKKAEEAVAGALRQLQDLQAQYKTLEETHAASSTTHAQDLALIGAGVNDAEVREFVRSRWKPEKEGDTFDGWIEAQRAEPSPLLRQYLVTPSQPAAEPKPAEATPAAEARPAAVGNPNAGAVAPAEHNGQKWGAPEIKAARGKAGGRGLGPNKDAILAQLVAEGAIKL